MSIRSFPFHFVSCNAVMSSLYASRCDSKGIIAPVLNSIRTSLYQNSYSFPYSQIIFCLSILSEASLSFSQYQIIYMIRLSAAHPNPQPGGPGYAFLSGSSPSTFPTCGALPAATLPPECLSASLTNQAPSLRQIKDTIRGNILPLFRPKHSYYFAVCYTCKFFSQD